MEFLTKSIDMNKSERKKKEERKEKRKKRKYVLHSSIIKQIKELRMLRDLTKEMKQNQHRWKKKLKSLCNQDQISYSLKESKNDKNSRKHGGEEKEKQAKEMATNITWNNVQSEASENGRLGSSKNTHFRESNGKITKVVRSTFSELCKLTKGLQRSKTFIFFKERLNIGKNVNLWKFIPIFLSQVPYEPWKHLPSWGKPPTLQWLKKIQQTLSSFKAELPKNWDYFNFLMVLWRTLLPRLLIWFRACPAGRHPVWSSFLGAVWQKESEAIV